MLGGFFMQKQYKKYFRSLFCAFLALMSYTWFFPQTAFRDCVHPAKQEIFSDHSLSEQDWITLFRPEENNFEITWLFKEW